MRTTQYVGVLTAAVSVAFVVASLAARLWTHLMPALPF